METKPQIRVLSIHGEYQCRHAGACCTSNWPIPIEADRLERARAAMASGRLRTALGGDAVAFERVADAPADTPARLGRAEHQCVFYDETAAAAAGRCRMQAALGHDGLPLACRQFPRVSVHDPRGVSVTLSHYCPTAAGLLDVEEGADADLTIVINPRGFPADGEYIGLEARTSLPPLLRRDMLMDWESWWACEERAVRLFAADEAPATAMSRLRMAVRDLEIWVPADGPLLDRVHDAFARANTRPASIPPPDGPALINVMYASIPAEMRPDPFPAAARPTDLATRRFLAAHAFANWSVHLGTGAAGWLRSIETAAALIHAGAGIRQADLLLRHLSG